MAKTSYCAITTLENHSVTNWLLNYISSKLLALCNATLSPMQRDHKQIGLSHENVDKRHVRLLYGTHTQKRKGRQNDCPGSHWGRWSLLLMYPVTSRAVILTTFSLLCISTDAVTKWPTCYTRRFFLWMLPFEFRLKFPCRVFPTTPMIRSQHWFT